MAAETQPTSPTPVQPPAMHPATVPASSATHQKQPSFSAQQNAIIMFKIARESLLKRKRDQYH